MPSFRGKGIPGVASSGVHCSLMVKMSPKYVVDTSVVVKWFSSRIRIPLITADYGLLAKLKDLPLVIPLREIKI